jgi:hypothetical protein
MIKLDSNLMQAAIQQARRLRPHVRRLAERSYSVSSSNPNVKPYTVTFTVADGHKFGECTCAAGQHSKPCYHLAAAAAVNIGLHRGYSRPSSPSHPLASILSKSGGNVLNLEGWHV